MNPLSMNHVVLKVRDLERSIQFYQRTLGLALVARERGSMAFLRAPGSSNHHDIGLLKVGASAPQASKRAPGLLHFAMKTSDITDLARFKKELTASGSLSGASDHGASKSIYGIDPDGNEFEILWLVPREHWGVYADRAPTMPLNLAAEIKRWAATGGTEATFQREVGT